MIYVMLDNTSTEDVVITIGGQPHIFKPGLNEVPKGIAEFATMKSRVLVTRQETQEEKTKPVVKPVEEVKPVVEEKPVEVTEEVVTPSETQETPVETSSNTEEVISAQPAKEPIDLEGYEKELKEMSKKDLIGICDFKEIEYSKNFTTKQLIKVILEHYEQ